MLSLSRPDLLLQDAYVNGEWLARDSRFQVLNPSTGAVLANVADCTVDDARAAIAAASVAQRDWAQWTGKERAAVLRRWFDLMVAHADDLAAILTAEMGKPLAEAKGEIMYGASFIEWFAEEAKRIYGDTIPGHQRDKRILVMKQPVGVVGAITPWNFPNAMITRKAGPALAAGCAMVVRPASETPLSALAIARLGEEAGLPAGVFSVLPSTDSKGIGLEFCENPAMQKISFTGSTNVGSILMRQGAAQIKKLSLELGGNAPFIVFDDADLDAAVEGALISKFRNAGQTCVCTNRIYVQDAVHDAFVEKLCAAVKALPVGDGFAEGTAIGPLISASAVSKVNEHISDAVAKGGQVATGGRPHALGGTFFQPTVITGVTQEMAVAREETFGPLAPVFRFSEVDEVLAAANDTEFGLASYLYSRDLSRIYKMMEGLEYGMVGVNTGLISTEVAPFGGVKLSGLGREGSKYGIEDYLELKYCCLSI
ncbi:NAD-dependent succinate-semialdehyde dehydrogenase [Leisingera sp. XS_AS12]|uniref:NAD-dependent succinate-semialdehyde dehydrogenase n=1 Tax=Leisingera sp. XS_AS12 TaxID=3241294 RepID=UPI003511BE26